MTGLTDVAQLAVPLAGPLDEPPGVAAAVASSMLAAALADLRLGEFDEHVQSVLVVAEHLEVVPADLVAAVASWVRRAWQAGAAAGRGELVDEAPAVAAARAQAEAYGRVLDEVVVAAAEAELVVGDDTADARVALATLLTRIARAVPDIAVAPAGPSTASSLAGAGDLR